MALSPYVWSGSTGQKVSPGQVKKYSDIAAALAARGGAPSNLGEGLARVGDALVFNSFSDRAAKGEAAGSEERKAVIDALLANPDPSMPDIAGALSNEWVASDPGSSAVVQALMAQENQQTQRGYALEDRNADWAHDSSVLQDQRAYDAPVREMQLQSGQQGIAQSAAMAPLDLKYKQAQIDALGAKPAVPPTPDIQEYNLAVQQGFKGTIQDWIAAKPKTGGVVVNTGDNSGAFGKKSDELAAARLGDIVTSGQGASKMMGDIKTLAALGSKIDTGVGAQVLNQLGPLAQAAGINIDGLSEGQAYQSIIDRMAPAMRPVGSGSSSDTDVRMFLNSLPSLGKTPEGNKIILDTLSAVQQHNLAAAQIAGKAFQTPEKGGIAWQDAEDQIRALPDPFEGFNAYAKQSSTGDPSAAAPAVAAPAQVAPADMPTAVNPTTGERIQWNGSAWVPMK